MTLDYLYNLCYRATYNKSQKHFRAKLLLTFIVSNFFTSIANFTIPIIFQKGQVGLIAMIIWFSIVLPPTIYTYRRYSNKELYLKIFNQYINYSVSQNKKLRITGFIIAILNFILVPVGLVMGIKLFW
jgi:hypothetical protein